MVSKCGVPIDQKALMLWLAKWTDMTVKEIKDLFPNTKTK